MLVGRQWPSNASVTAPALGPATAAADSVPAAAAGGKAGAAPTGQLETDNAAAAAAPEADVMPAAAAARSWQQQRALQRVYTGSTVRPRRRRGSHTPDCPAEGIGRGCARQAPTAGKGDWRADGLSHQVSTNRQ